MEKERETYLQRILVVMIRVECFQPEEEEEEQGKGIHISAQCE